MTLDQLFAAWLLVCFPFTVAVARFIRIGGDA
jgi:hypothetical protein